MKNIKLKNRIIIIFVGILFVLIVFCFKKVINLNNYVDGNNENFLDDKYLDEALEKFLVGKWKIDELIGFASIHKDDVEYPSGQDVLKNEIIIEKNYFSTKGIYKYPDYQYEVDDPIYYISYMYGKDNIGLFLKSYPTEINGSLNITMEDVVKELSITTKEALDSETILPVPCGFYIVNDERLILHLDSVFFELKKVE